MQKKWWLISIIVVLLVGVGIWVNGKRSQHALPDGFVGSNGRLELQRMDVATLYAGRVIKMNVDEGDVVKKDDVLAELSSDQSSSQLMGAQAAKQRALETVARAEAEISARIQQQKIAQLDLDNTLQLKKQDLVSSAELSRRQSARDAAVAAVKAAQAAKSEAQAAVDQAQAQIDYASSANQDMLIRAPQNGRVEYRIAQPGNVLGAGYKVVTLLDPSDVSMYVFLPTNTVGTVKVGDEARIVLDGIQAVWPATVEFIADKSQFTPKYVETANEREKLMYKVKLRIEKDTALKYTNLLKGGLTGNGYIRLNSQQNWPQQWQVKLPEQSQNKGE